jgi:hypothetical protein
MRKMPLMRAPTMSVRLRQAWWSRETLHKLIRKYWKRLQGGFGWRLKEAIRWTA